jgi:succinoglycan biosynthesis protein ExoM
MVEADTDGRHGVVPSPRVADVVVCVCTAGRTELLPRLLDAIVDQRLPPDLCSGIAVAVVDNNPEPEAEQVVRRWATETGLTVSYRHVPQRGLSQARNAVLQAATELSDLAALIDDDEVPDPDWLAGLLRTRIRTGAPIVIGPVVAGYGADLPSWVARGRFFDLASWPEGTALDDGITGNALLHLPTLAGAGLSFDDRFARSGGEDQLFFKTALARGLAMRFAAGAVVVEPVPTARGCLSFLLRRELRKGNTLGLLAAGHPELGERPTRRLLAAAKWAATGAGQAVFGPLLARHPDERRVQAARGVLRLARAAGMLGGLIGWRYEPY